ncbi:hypothetical protein SmJEL517_g02107 [Synchytrium microbalum]|uniref:Response regulatory domain-containing protein n=1 Tax=Synchytrium microbalum TaxID=1806994 RepID=A0A507CCB9_9FUNG|nr:uncharacterized protein SmJEL517_g02107 [Synchytrium microbalum]TPX35594.1 hypothetical protein SmJEL517_g02107 [Synchytrium microbalum]
MGTASCTESRCFFRFYPHLQHYLDIILQPSVLVDDSDVNRLVLQCMLKRVKPDLDMHMANDGQEAIDLAEQHKYQTIFSWTPIAHIRKVGRNIETPIIIITSANIITEDQNFARCEVLLKSFQVNDLKDFLDRYIV